LYNVMIAVANSRPELKRSGKKPARSLLGIRQIRTPQISMF
jgi:hypothetical protein